MKNIKAFVMAFILFLLTITGIKLLSFHGLPQYSLAYGTWIDSSKFTSNDGLKKLLEDKESIPVFGSSELRQSQKTGFHADDIYKKGGLKPVFIGKGGHQSLFHSIVLGSLGDTLKNRKLVLSVSPQWFKTTGVRKDAFGDSYSESNFIAFLKNKNISDPVKNYVIGRMQKLSEENPAMYERIEEDVNWYYKRDGNIGDQVRAKIHSFLVSEKADTRLLLNMMWKDKFHEEKNVDSHRQIDWNSYYKKAEKKGKQRTGKNKLGMLDKVYESKFKERVQKKDFKELSGAYAIDSVEFQDLENFLQICAEQNTEVLLIMQPFNGKWCDYLNLPTKEREKFYDKVKEIAQKNGVSIFDMSDYEYGDYIFKDDSHLALKGLVKFNEQIYKFYNSDKK